MKINDIVFQFQTRPTSKDGICRLRTFVNSQSQVSIILTELDNNTSASITNSIEHISNYLTEKGMLKGKATLIEHYESSGFSTESFDQVFLEDDNDPRKTEWKKLSKAKVIKLIECEDDEFELGSNDRIRVLNESERISSSINPSRNLPYPEEPNYIVRALDIEANQISKESILQLVNSGANERQLQELLKKDLSVFAELYSSPPDQYICLSEFPWDDGFIDFVVLSGISRMDVILIEIKGADFNFINKGHYKKMSSKMETAIHQIRQRIGSICRNLEEFRTFIHSIREKVESGQSIYNSLLGPEKILQVDPNKNINIYPVVIGGVMTDDLYESRTRHEAETTFTPRIKIESWNSWIRKLQRK